MIGQPFNRHSTFHHEAMGIGKFLGHAAVENLIKLARDWFATRGHRLKWTYTREDGPGKGAHCHILWHIPPELASDFFARWPGWKAILAQAYAQPGIGHGGRVMKTRTIGGTANTYRSNPQFFAFHLDQVLGYVLKGAEPATIAALDLAKPHEPGGAVIGRRAGWWREHRPRKRRA